LDISTLLANAGFSSILVTAPVGSTAPVIGPVTAIGSPLFSDRLECITFTGTSTITVDPVLGVWDAIWIYLRGSKTNTITSPGFAVAVDFELCFEAELVPQ
jgi:hypothetical protein